MEQVNAAVWSNPLIFLTHELFGITHTESMFRLRRNQVCISRNWKRSQREISEDEGPFLKMPFFSRCFSHMFAIAKQLTGFPIGRFASVENFFSGYIFCLNVNIYVSI